MQSQDADYSVIYATMLKLDERRNLTSFRPPKKEATWSNDCSRHADLETEELQIYRLGSLKFFPSKNSPSIRSRSSGWYLTYFWGFFPPSTIGLQRQRRVWSKCEKFCYENLYIPARE